MICLESRISYFQYKLFSLSKFQKFRSISSLQKLFIHSLCARLKSVSILENAENLSILLGKNLVLDSKMKFQIVLNLRKNIVPKFSKNILISKKIGLSMFFKIPNLFYKSFQVLWHMSIIPYVETFSDSFSFGFRPYRDSLDIFNKLKSLVLPSSNFFNISIIEFDFFLSTNNSWLFKNFPIQNRVLLSWVENRFFLCTSSKVTEFNLVNIYPTLVNFSVNGLFCVLYNI